MLKKANLQNLEYFSNYILRGVIKEYIQDDTTRFSKKQLIEKIVELAETKNDINDKIEKRVFLPDNIELPFFAYGIFKPHQIAYHVIDDLVESFDQISINGFEQFLRDGLSFIIKTKKPGSINGYKINFKSEKALEAYFKISDKEPKSLYKWAVIDNMNALIARDDKGLDIDFLGDPDNIIGWNDPYFHIGLEVIKSQEMEMSRLNFDINSKWDEKRFFAEMIFVQMKFLLAYSMLERLAFLMTSFQSGSAQVSNILADNDFVRKAITKLYYELDEKVKDKERVVYSSERTVTSKGDVRTGKVTVNFKNCINKGDFKSIIKFYYQIRNNITHRGKSLGRLSIDFKSYLSELTLIIKYTIEFGQQSKK